MGSIRAVTDESNTLIAAYDYDAGGYLLREWKSGDDAKYKFTSKERDSETSYDYFGARYYDSRIGRWGQTDPLFEKHIENTPYNYALNRPLLLFDPDGMQAYFAEHFRASANFNTFIKEMREVSGMGVYVDNSGYLRLANFMGKPVLGTGSATARKWVTKMLSVNGLTVQSLTAIRSKGVNSSDNSAGINLNPDQINAFEKGANNVDPRTMGWAMVMIHEFLHTLFGMNFQHPEDMVFGEKDALIDEMNKIRNEMESLDPDGLSWGEEQSHIWLNMSDRSPEYYGPMSRTSRDMMRMDKIKPPKGERYIRTESDFNH